MADDENWIRCQLVDEFLRVRIKNYRERTQTNYSKHLKLFVEYCSEQLHCSAEDINFASCTPARFQGRSVNLQIQPEFIVKYLGSIPAKTTKLDAQRVLYNYFSYLNSRGMIRSNPVPKLPYRPKVISSKQGLHPEELKQFLDHMDAVPMPHKFAIFIDLFAGLRVSELLALRTDDLIKHPNGFWSLAIQREAMKGGVAFMLPLPVVDRLVEEYFNWRKENKIESEYLIFDVPRVTASSINNWIRRVCQEAGLPSKLSSHDLRRTFATYWSSHLADPDILRWVMRHRQTITSWLHYVAVALPKDIADAVSKLPVVQLCEDLVQAYLENLNSDTNRYL